jgi:hypothetical protein
VYPAQVEGASIQTFVPYDILHLGLYVIQALLFTAFVLSAHAIDLHGSNLVHF